METTRHPAGRLWRKNVAHASFLLRIRAAAAFTHQLCATAARITTSYYSCFYFWCSAISCRFAHILTNVTPFCGGGVKISGDGRAWHVNMGLAKKRIAPLLHAAYRFVNITIINLVAQGARRRR